MKFPNKYFSNFEQNLANELSKLGIYTQSNFHIPGSKYEVDLYIKAPIRSIIEIKSNAASAQAIKLSESYLNNIYKEFNKSICIFIINIGSIIF